MILTLNSKCFDEIYKLLADMGYNNILLNEQSIVDKVLEKNIF